MVAKTKFQWVDLYKIKKMLNMFLPDFLPMKVEYNIQ